MSDSSRNYSNVIDVKSLRHKAEMPLHIISLVISLTVYGLLTYYGFKAVNDESASDILLRYLEDEESYFEPLLKYGAYFVIAALIN